MNSNEKNNFFSEINNIQQNFNSCTKYTPTKLNNNIFQSEFLTPTQNQDNQVLSYASKYPRNRIFTESKKTKLNDMKKNVCDRLMSRIIDHRRERMDNILYFKPSIIEKCKNEYYEVNFLKLFFRILFFLVIRI